MIGNCKDCKWWSSDITQLDGRACERTFDSLEAESLMWAEAYDSIFTKADFGCVQFEPKPSQAPVTADPIE
jgi:hypothetical protein